MYNYILCFSSTVHVNQVMEKLAPDFDLRPDANSFWAFDFEISHQY